MGRAPPGVRASRLTESPPYGPAGAMIAVEASLRMSGSSGCRRPGRSGGQFRGRQLLVPCSPAGQPALVKVDPADEKRDRSRCLPFRLEVTRQPLQIAGGLQAEQCQVGPEFLSLAVESKLFQLGFQQTVQMFQASVTGDSGPDDARPFPAGESAQGSDRKREGRHPPRATANRVSNPGDTELLDVPQETKGQVDGRNRSQPGVQIQGAERGRNGAQVVLDFRRNVDGDEGADHVRRLRIQSRAIRHVLVRMPSRSPSSKSFRTRVPAESERPR